MANTAEKVSVGKPNTSGAIYRAKTGVTLPTNPTDKLDENDWTALGYISEDGLTNGNSIDSESIKAWGGVTVLTSQTGREETFQFSMIESLNADVLATVYGEDHVKVADDGTITVEASSDEMVAQAWCVDMIMRNNAIKRIVIPAAALTDLSDITYKDDEVVGYEITITATPDENGITHFEYLKPADETDTGDNGGDEEPKG